MMKNQTLDSKLRLLLVIFVLCVSIAFWGCDLTPDEDVYEAPAPVDNSTSYTPYYPYNPIVEICTYNNANEKITGADVSLYISFAESCPNEWETELWDLEKYGTADFGCKDFDVWIDEKVKLCLKACGQGGNGPEICDTGETQLGVDHYYFNLFLGD